MWHLRVASAEDALALALLAEKTFRDTFSAGSRPDDMNQHCAAMFAPDIQRRELQDPNVITIVAQSNTDLIGYAQLKLVAPKDCVTATRPTELHRFYVAQTWHGKGVAGSLMKEVFSAAIRNESDCMWLGVWEHNSRARAFYQRFGFKVVGQHVFQLGSDAQRDVIMACTELTNK